MKVGQNLESLTYYASTPVFVNSMKAARSWMTRPVGSNEWDSKQSDSIVANIDGYPTVVPFWASGAQHFVHTMVPVFENGTHRFRCSGKGTLVIKGPGVSAQTFQVNGSLSVTLTASGAKDIGAIDPGSPFGERHEPSFWYVEIRTTDSSDPIRDLRIMRPGFHNAGRDQFDPVFLNHLSQYDTLRVMDWLRTNNSGRTLANVPSNRKSYYTQATSDGVAYDHIIDLANQTGKNIWICVPHLFTQQARHDMAYRFAYNLQAGRICYVEYSNEVWNPKFDQHKWVTNNTSIPGSNTHQRYGTKAAEVFGAFKTHFDNAGKGGQLRRVLAGQNTNSWTLSQALVTAGSTTDLLAVAPYFGRTFGSVPNPIPSLDDLATETHSLMSERMNAFTTIRNLAQSNGKGLVCYEGGQHYVAGDQVVNNQALTSRMIEFNRNYRLRNLYRYTYLNQVRDRGPSLFVHFTLTNRFSKWGSWGSMEWGGQTIGTGANQAQKEWALRNWMAANP